MKYKGYPQDGLEHLPCPLYFNRFEGFSTTSSCNCIDYIWCFLLCWIIFNIADLHVAGVPYVCPWEHELHYMFVDFPKSPQTQFTQLQLHCIRSWRLFLMIPGLACHVLAHWSRQQFCYTSLISKWFDCPPSSLGWICNASSDDCPSEDRVITLCLIGTWRCSKICSCNCIAFREVSIVLNLGIQSLAFDCRVPPCFSTCKRSAYPVHSLCSKLCVKIRMQLQWCP